jgi:hypothetical protein
MRNDTNEVVKARRRDASDEVACTCLSDGLGSQSLLELNAALNARFSAERMVVLLEEIIRKTNVIGRALSRQEA